MESTNQEKKPSERDQELEAIRKLRKLLDPLGFSARRRVMAYLDNYYTSLLAADTPTPLDAAK